VLRSFLRYLRMSGRRRLRMSGAGVRGLCTVE
jgi:hypothetical protein